MKSLIVARVKGGLGNQLFCYAAARRLSIVSGVELALDDKSGFSYDYDYRRSYQLHHFEIPCRLATAAERFEPLSRLRRALKRRLNRARPFDARRYLEQEGVDFDARLLEVNPVGILHLDGYWQSEGYFADVKDAIRTELRVVPPSDSRNSDMAVRIREAASVALHVRFFDAPGQTQANNASIHYYRAAIRQIERLVESPHYFVFSDRPKEAIASLSLDRRRFTLVSHNEGDENAYADLWLMSLCKHFVIANSTFSWWGAWLGRYPDKKVVAPGFEMRGGKMSWGFDGLLPEEWIRI